MLDMTKISVVVIYIGINGLIGFSEKRWAQTSEREEVSNDNMDVEMDWQN